MYLTPECGRVIVHDRVLSDGACAACTDHSCSGTPEQFVSAGNTVVCSVSFTLASGGVFPATGFFSYRPGVGDELCSGCHSMIFRDNIDGDTSFTLSNLHGNQDYTATETPNLTLSAGSHTLQLIYFAQTTGPGSDIIHSSSLDICA